MTISPYTIKKATNDQEIQDAFTIRKKVFVQEQEVPEEMEIDEFEDQSEHVIVYNREHHPVGAGRLRIINDIEAKVERICVDSQLRGQHLGELIMEHIEKIAKSKGIQTLLLHAQDHAEGFYSRLGYSTISDPFDEAGIMHIKMKKELNS
ncbi:GNAT family N-acetyltransferase [Caldalkalibacillus mannanilyticus]|uniref:GNAT family N-acetyltransferase n=1 Tax=Caldalkalibacillus mannanilyticus TaxID=1418 RepID=UPI000552A303|nr:GNAT family N-acetyltransferase [Caldalkalibacillus mannanilyticus]